MGLAAFFLIGYGLTVVLETPVMYWGLSPCRPRGLRLGAAALLTAWSYPFVIFVFPVLWAPGGDRLTYLVAAETFAPLCEMFVWRFVVLDPKDCRGGAAGVWRRDFPAITAANVFSFVVGEIGYRLSGL